MRRLKSKTLRCLKNNMEKEILMVRVEKTTVGLLQCEEYDANDKICESCRLKAMSMGKKEY